MPQNKWFTAVQIPPQSSQIILANSEKQPEVLSRVTTFLPKGNMTIAASLKHCSPKGIPTIVKQRISPPIAYPRAANSPPKMSQIRLPNKFITVAS